MTAANASTDTNTKGPPMSETSKPCGCLDFMLLLNRISMGTILVLLGAIKLKKGLENFVTGDFAYYKPGWLPDALARPYAYAIPFLEIVLGAALVLGLFTRCVAPVLVLMILSFTIAMATLNGFGLEPKQMQVYTNVLYMTLLLLLMTTGGGRFSLHAVLFKRCCVKCG
jgi:uncharacterized membrane protein YphA (DoxX/SURF4 family)